MTGTLYVTADIHLMVLLYILDALLYNAIPTLI